MEEPLEDLMLELEAFAAERNAVIYNICFRKAGCGICWHEGDREENGEWKSGLIVHGYHDDLRSCLEAELHRIKSKGLKLVV